MDEVYRLLASTAYDLHFAIIYGAIVNYDAIVAYLKTGETSENIIQSKSESAPEKESILVPLLEDLLNDHIGEINDDEVAVLQRSIDSLTSPEYSVGGYYLNNESHIKGLTKVREQLVKDGIEITDKELFIESLKRAVANSDQSGLE